MLQNSKQQISFEFPCSFNIFVQVEALHLQIAIQIKNVVQYTKRVMAIEIKYFSASKLVKLGLLMRFDMSFLSNTLKLDFRFY